jgi:hypothetical protein
MYWFADTGHANFPHGPFETLSEMRDHLNRARMRAEIAKQAFPAPHEIVAYRKRPRSPYPCRAYFWRLADKGLCPAIDKNFPRLPPELPEDLPDPQRETASQYIERLQANAGEWSADTRDDGDDESGIL